MAARVASGGGGPPSSQTQSTSVSYETYAPRSTTQRDRLARIAELTSGPEAWASRGKGGGGDDASPASRAAATASFLLRAMSVPPPAPPTEVSPSFDDDNPAGDGADDGDVGSPFLFHDDGEGKSAEADAASDAETIRRSMAASGRTASSLRSCIETGSALRDSLRTATDLARDLSGRHSDLVSRSGELSTACERLRTEEAVLSRHAEDIGAPLRHYDAVDGIGVRVGVLFKERGRVVVRGLARVNVDSDEYVEVLDEIDEALAFFLEAQERQRLQQQQGHHGMVPGQASSFPMAAEGPEYCRRAMALHEAATYLEAVVDRINQATTDIMAALNMPKRVLPADKLEASLIYTRFHGISSRSNSLITILQHRVDRPGGYRELLDLCQNMYCSSREQLLKATVRAHMDTLRDQHGLVGMTRLASLFLMRLCSVETALYLDFFGMPPASAGAAAKSEGKDGEDGEGSAAAGGKAKRGGDESAAGKSAASAAGPPGAPMSKNEPSPMLDDDPFQKMLGSLCSNLHRTVRRGVVLLSDLDLLCQVVGVLREERAAANASPGTRATARAISGVIEDAQERLIFCTQVVLQREVIRFRPSAADLDYPAKLLVIESAEGAGEGGGGGEDAVQAQMKVYEAWFPPMRSVLRVLSKIFRVVEPRVFEDIALQAVHSCTKSLKDAAAYISSKQGVVHSDLFLVKHLLILREQLSPFDIQLRAVERQLDFSEAGKAVTKFLANRNRRIFSMSNENALVTLLREGVSVQESSVDSKRDLEDALRSACNDFIEHTSLKLAGPLLEFVEQCKFASSSSSVELKTQGFMNGEFVKCIFVDTNKALASELDTLKSHMAVYLESSATQGILLKPVARKITRSLDDAKRFISEMEDEENGWDSSLKVEVLALAKDIEQAVKEASSKTASR